MLGQGLVEGVLADGRAQRRLGDVGDRGLDVLDREDGLHRIHDAVVGDRRDVHGDVVAGDDLLRLDRHRDDPQRHAVHAVDERDMKISPGPRGPSTSLPSRSCTPRSYCLKTFTAIDT